MSFLEPTTYNWSWFNGLSAIEVADEEMHDQNRLRCTTRISWALPCRRLGQYSCDMSFATLGALVCCTNTGRLKTGRDPCKRPFTRTAKCNLSHGRELFTLAGRTRLRPVLMTALAMIIGMLPMSLGLGEGGEQNAPLGRAVIGGLILATASTLLFVPVVYSLLRAKSQPQATDIEE